VISARSFVRLALAFMSLSALLASPSINRISPPAFRVGVTNEVTFYGSDLAAPNLWLSFPAEVRWTKTNEAGEVSCEILPLGDSLGIGALRLFSTNGLSPLEFVPLLTSGAQASAGTNTTLANAQGITRKSLIHGTIKKAAASDFYRFTMKRGESAEIEVLANRIGSALDPIIRIVSPSNKELAYADDFPIGARDGRVSFKAPESEDYFIEIRDSAFTGSEKHSYVLAITEEPLPRLVFLDIACSPQPQDAEREPNGATNDASQLSFPTTVRGEFGAAKDRDWFKFEVPEAGRIRVAARSRVLGSPCDVWLRAVSATGEQLAVCDVTHTEDTTLTFKADKPGAYFIEARELTGRGFAGLTYELLIDKWKPSFTLSTDLEKLEVTPGGTIPVPIKSIRKDFDDEIVLHANGLPEGFTLENEKFASKKNETELKLKAPENAVPGSFYEIMVVGKATWQGQEILSTVSSRPALKKTFPLMLYQSESLASVLHIVIKAK
jgi:hypothetical protein